MESCRHTQVLVIASSGLECTSKYCERFAVPFSATSTATWNCSFSEGRKVIVAVGESRGFWVRRGATCLSREGDSFLSLSVLAAQRYIWFIQCAVLLTKVLGPRYSRSHD